MSIKIPARGLVVAPRLPPRPKDYTTMFAGLGRMLVSCEDPNCDWVYMGTRMTAKEAITEHNLLMHSDCTTAHVLMINKPRQ